VWWSDVEEEWILKTADGLHMVHVVLSLCACTFSVYIVHNKRLLNENAISIRVSAPSVWNSLSLDCRSAQLASSVRRSIATDRTVRHRIHWMLWLVSTIMCLQFACDITALCRFVSGFLFDLMTLNRKFATGRKRNRRVFTSLYAHAPVWRAWSLVAMPFTYYDVK